MRPTTEGNKWDWPDELDAIVAAPGNHQVLLENDRVRVIDTTVAIGATTPVHTHRWRSVEYVLSATDFVRGDGEGTVVFDTRAARGVAPVGSFVGATVPPHSVENVGDTELRVVMVGRGSGWCRRSAPRGGYGQPWSPTGEGGGHPLAEPLPTLLRGRRAIRHATPPWTRPDTARIEDQTNL